MIGSTLLLFGWSCIKTGLLGSKKLIDGMCLDNKIPRSKEAEKEWRKINKME